MFQLIFQRAVQFGFDRTIAGHIDIDGWDMVQRVGLVVGQHRIAMPQSFDKGAIAGRREAHDLDPARLCLGEVAAQAQSGLGRGAAHNNLLGTEKFVIQQPVVNQIRRRQQRLQQGAQVIL